MTDTPATTAPKSGFKTSEFWLTAAATLVGLLIASGAVTDASAIGKAIAFVASALAAAGYSYGRALVKSA